MMDAEFFSRLLEDVREKERELLAELVRAQLLEREIVDLMKNNSGGASLPPRCC